MTGPIRSNFPGLTNYEVRVPGTTVTCAMGVWDDNPSKWTYSLWTDDDDFIAVDKIDFQGLNVTPEQVARIAFILHCEYERD